MATKDIEVVQVYTGAQVPARGRGSRDERNQKQDELVLGIVKREEPCTFSTIFCGIPSGTRISSVDKSMQRLRKAGKVVYAHGKWTVVPPVPAVEQAEPQQQHPETTESV